MNTHKACWFLFQSLIGLEYLFLVGGFAESPILQFEIRKEFERLMKIVIPQEVSLTILKGNTYYHSHLIHSIIHFFLN